MAKLYICVQDEGDGSQYPYFTLDKRIIDKLEAGFEYGIYDYSDIGCDGDGFHYETINIPDGSTYKSLGITESIIEDTYK